MKKITIIGMGFLMEYIFPCVRGLNGEDTPRLVNAVTADAGDLEGKRERLKIPVLLNDSLTALRTLEPDWIFFAPPPTVAPGLVETCLKPYCEQCRAAGRPLPVLFAFPPKPAGAYYQEQLGGDLAVVNIIPNMISTVGSEPVPAESCHLITYPKRDNFTPEMKRELEELLRPMGRPLVVEPDKILPVLSAEIGTHPLTELAEVAARALTDAGTPADYPAAASSMRFWHQKKRGFRSQYSNNVREDAVPDAGAREKMNAVLDCWYDALTHFLLDAGMDAEGAKRLLDPLFDLYLHEAQLETREEIVAKARKDATPGGMLELCLECYHEDIEPLLYRVLSAAGPVAGEDLERLNRLIRLAASDVVRRGKGLTGGTADAFTPEHHAVLFGALARRTLEAFGDAALALYGRVDVLVNNAGVAPRVRADLLEMTEESFDFVLGVNTKGTMFMSQCVARQMAGQTEENGARGIIVNIGSMSAEVSSVSRGEYCVSKAGVAMLTKLYGDRLARDHVYVYEVRPGIIATDMTAKVQEKYDKFFAENGCPINRWGTPEDIALAVSLLCEGRLPYTTGQYIDVDGGFHISRL